MGKCTAGKEGQYTKYSQCFWKLQEEVLGFPQSESSSVHNMGLLGLMSHNLVPLTRSRLPITWFHRSLYFSFVALIIIVFK